LYRSGQSPCELPSRGAGWTTARPPAPYRPGKLPRLGRPLAGSVDVARVRGAGRGFPSKRAFTRTTITRDHGHRPASYLRPPDALRLRRTHADKTNVRQDLPDAQRPRAGPPQALSPAAAVKIVPGGRPLLRHSRRLAGVMRLHARRCWPPQE